MQARELIDQVPWLSSLDAGAKERLAGDAQPLVWGAHQIVCRQDDEDRTCFVLGAGSMRVARSLPDGRAVTLAHLSPPAAFGELALLGVGRRNATVSALEDSEGIALSAESVQSVLREDPQAALDVAADL